MPDPKITKDRRLLQEYADTVYNHTEGRTTGGTFNELLWMNDQRLELNKMFANRHPDIDDNELPFHESYLAKFTAQRDREAAWYDKSMRLWQTDPNETTQNNLLAGLRLFKSIPMEAMLSKENPDGSRGFYLSLPSHYSDISADQHGEAGRLSRIPIDPDKFPTIHNGKVEYIKLNSKNTLFHNNRGDFLEGIKLYEEIFSEPYLLNAEEASSTYNHLLKFSDNADAIGKPLVNGSFDIPRASPNILVGRVGETAEEGDDDPTVPTQLLDLEDPVGALKSMRAATGGANNQPLSVIDVELYNTLTSVKPLEDVFSEDEEAEWHKFWKEQHPQAFEDARDVTNLNTRIWLGDQIARMKWEALEDQDRAQLEDLMGLVGRDGMTSNSSHINRNGIDGRGRVNFADGTHSMATPEATAAFTEFKNNQRFLHDRNEPDGWNSGIKAKEVAAGPQEMTADAYDQHIRVKTDMLMRLLQKMHTGEGGAEGSGLELDPDLSDEEVHKIAEHMSNAVTLAGTGQGLQGASKVDMDLAMDIISQILHATNMAALRGQRTEPFRHRINKTYTGLNAEGEQRNYMHDFRKQEGHQQIQDDYGPFWLLTQQASLMKEEGYSEEDPQYQLIKNFMQVAEGFVIMEGLKGNKVTPVPEWFGWRTSSDDKVRLPLRVEKIRLRGTDVEATRFVEKNLKAGVFFKHPLISEAISGSSPSRKPIDRGSASAKLRLRQELDLKNKETTEIEPVDKGTLGVIRHAQDSWKDTNKDGVVDQKEALVADQRELKENPKRRK